MNRAGRFFGILMTPVIALSLCVSNAGAAEDAAHPLIVGDTHPIEVNYAVNDGLEWQYSASHSDETHDAYIAGNCGASEQTQYTSNIALKVKNTGVLSFDWRINNSTGTFDLIYKWDKPVSSIMDLKNDNSYSGSDKPWKRVELAVDESILGSDGEATLYIGFYRGSATTYADTYAAIANVNQRNDTKNLHLDITGSEYGDVTGATVGDNDQLGGDKVTLTASEKNGGRFYGWSDGDGKFLGSAKELTIDMDTDKSVTAVFAATGSYKFRKNGEFYGDGTSLNAIFSGTSDGDVVELLENYELTENVTVPSGVELYIPFSETYCADGHERNKTGGSALSEAAAYRTLTVPSGVTLTVDGKLVVSGMNSTTSHNYQGHTSGACGWIECDGDIVVNSGGVLNLWGYVDGNGNVTVESGGKAYEPFIVNDWAGGSCSEGLFEDDQVPFKRYAMQNIQCTLKINAGGALWAHCSLYTASTSGDEKTGGFNETDAPFLSPGTALFVTKGNTTVVRTYDGTKALTGSTTNGTTGIGRTTWTVTGDMDFRSLSMRINAFGINIDLSTSCMDFPIPYNFVLDLQDGTYSVPGRLKLMPGAEMHIGENAILDVTGWLAVYDGLKQSAIGINKQYPTSEELQSGGFSSAAVLEVNGTMKVHGGTVPNKAGNTLYPAAFGGIVQTSGQGAVIELENGVTLSRSMKDGNTLTYNNVNKDNRSLFTLEARANVDGRLTALTGGKTYYAWSGSGFTQESYTASWCPGYGQALQDVTVTVNQAMKGLWSLSVPVESDIEVVRRTYYDETDASRTSVPSFVDAEDPTYKTLTVEKEDPAYAYRVSYLTGTNEVTVKANADGTYTIPKTASKVTVMSVLLGDTDLDGDIMTGDVILLARAMAGIVDLNEIETLAADCGQDGSIMTDDVIALSRYLAGLSETVY